MAESTSAEEPGAPVAKDAIDPELVKLGRPRAKIGAITAAGVVFLCVVFLLRLNADRTFGGESEPTKVTVAQILAGEVGSDEYVTLDAEPLMSHAIRTSLQKGGLGLRVAPVRGTGEQLWLVLPGNGWEAPTTRGYTGRLRKLSALSFASALDDYAESHPRPMFATAAAARTAFSSGKVVTVSGETLAITDADAVALDVVDPNTALIVAALNERLPNAEGWASALRAAGITATPLPAPTDQTDQLRYEVKGPAAVATTTTKLEAASLWAARVEPVTRHYQTTWGALKGGSAAGFTVAQGVTIPDAEIDLVGLYISKEIPDGAYAVIDGEKPQDYWYVLPISIGLLVIGLVFLWALVRAIKRDFLQTPTPS
ncbi:MAG: hypothetical protein JNL83_04820 [Myxococcales bacterium]|nr:hypothetical protein [Myxococcales bacterium]